MLSNSLTRRILSSLAAEYPDATCSLNFQSPLELLIATILSAQCTDERVNQVTKSLFQKYRTARDYASVPLSELESDIQSTGFYRNKAKSIRACCERLDREFGGKVPPDMDALVELPGVGRKTANVVLGTAFGIPSGIVVDTHVARISRRLGFTDQNDPVKIEQDLMAIIPQSGWIAFSHRVIQHGRRYCKAKKPNCRDCPLADPCPKIGVAEAAEALPSKRTSPTPAVRGKAKTATPQAPLPATGSRGKGKGKG
ncbi:MAG: endonuclease III [Thermogutta sp.]